MKTSLDETERAKAQILVEWLVRGPRGPDAVATLRQDLESSDKKAKLAAALVVEHVEASSRKRGSREPPGKGAKAGQSGEGQPAMGVGGLVSVVHDDEALPVLRSLLGPLVDCVRSDGVPNAEGRLQHTRLTTLAFSDAVFLLDTEAETFLSPSATPAVLIADEDSDEEISLPFVGFVREIVRLLHSLLPYSRGDFFASSTISCILRFFEAMIPSTTEKSTIEPDAIVAISRFWIAVSTGLKPKLVVMSKAKFQRYFAKTVEEVTETTSDSHRTLATLCCAIGSRPPAELENLLADAEIEQKLYVLVSQNVRISDRTDDSVLPDLETPHSFLIASSNLLSLPVLSSLLLRRLMAIKGPDRIQPIVDTFLLSLDDTDGAPTPAAGFLADYAAARPDEVLDAVFTRLDSDDPAKRRNALAVLEEVFAIDRDVLAGSPRLRDALVEHILPRLHDEDINLRKQAALLFSHCSKPAPHRYRDNGELSKSSILSASWSFSIEPAAIIPRLCALLTNSDPRVRSAAEVALVSILTEYRSGVDAVFAFLEHARDVDRGKSEQSPYIPKSPGEVAIPIASAGRKKDDTSQILDRLFRVANKWASVTTPAFWSVTIPLLVDKAYAAPNDAVIIRFLTAVAPFWVGEVASRTVISSVVKKMMRQPRLTSDLSKATTDDDVLARQGVLFARLSPLLILRVLPLECLDWLICPPNDEVPTFWDAFADDDPRSNEHFSDDTISDLESGSDMLRLGRQLIVELLIRFVHIEGEKIGFKIAISMPKSLHSHQFICSIQPPRIEHPIEFDPIRTMAIQLTGRLPLPILGPILSRKLPSSSTPSSAPARALPPSRIIPYLACACHMVVARGVRAAPEGVEVALPALLEMLSWTDVDDEQVDKLRTGSTECLSLFVVVLATDMASKISGTPSRNATPLIEELSSTPVTKPTSPPNTPSFHTALPPRPTLHTVLDSVLALLHPTPAHSSPAAALVPTACFNSGPVATAAANALTLAARRMVSGGRDDNMAPGTRGPPDEKGLAALAWLARTVTSRVVEAVDSIRRGLARGDSLRGWEVVGAAALQVLFQCAFDIKNSEDIPLGDIVDVSVEAIASSDEEL
ncbi:hypothetical protein BDK51DRAFT_45605, partial [Blyttiomyces helicus]